MIPPLKTPSIRRLLRLQAAAVVAFAVIGGLWEGVHGAVSGALGAAINLVANFVYALMAGVVRPGTAAGAILVIMRAEGFKIGLILASLALVMSFYRALASGPFIVAFIATALMFGIALRASGARAPH